MWGLFLIEKNLDLGAAKPNTHPTLSNLRDLKYG